MTNQAKLMRKADALCKIIRQAREECSRPKTINPYVRMAQAGGMKVDDERKLLEILTDIVNRAGRRRSTSTGSETVDVPLALLQEARGALERYRDTEYSSKQLCHATNRVW